MSPMFSQYHNRQPKEMPLRCCSKWRCISDSSWQCLPRTFAEVVITYSIHILPLWEVRSTADEDDLTCHISIFFQRCDLSPTREIQSIPSTIFTSWEWRIWCLSVCPDILWPLDSTSSLGQRLAGLDMNLWAQIQILAWQVETNSSSLTGW